MESFDTPWRRFRCVTTQRGIAIIAISLILGIATIEILRYIALLGFDAQSSAILTPFRDIIENRFDARIIAWITGTFGFFWEFAGRQLRKIDRLF